MHTSTISFSCISSVSRLASHLHERWCALGQIISLDIVLCQTGTSTYRKQRLSWTVGALFRFKFGTHLENKDTPGHARMCCS